MKVKDEHVAIGIGLLALGLGAYNLLGKVKPTIANPDGGGSTYELPWMKAGPGVNNDDSNPTINPNVEGVGEYEDLPAALGPGDTAVENQADLYINTNFQPVPMTGSPDSNYNTRDIFNKLGWSEAQFQAGWENIIGKRLGGTGPGIANEDLPAAALYAYGYSPNLQAAAQRERYWNLIEKEGGSIVGGVVHPPAGESVTAFTQRVGALAKGGNTAKSRKQAEPPVDSTASPVSYIGEGSGYYGLGW